MELRRVLRNSRMYPDVNTFISEIVLLRRTNYTRLLSNQGHSLLYPRLVAGTALEYTLWIRHEDVVKGAKVKNVYILATCNYEMRHGRIIINLFINLFFNIFFW